MAGERYRRTPKLCDAIGALLSFRCLSLVFIHLPNLLDLRQHSLPVTPVAQEVVNEDHLRTGSFGYG